MAGDLKMITSHVAKCPCGSCGGHIEFPAEHAGTTVKCPHCGNETLLFIPQPSAPNRRLRACRSCGKEVSVDAEVCPHCGAAFVSRKRHGVFYYVFWSLVSLLFLAVAIPAALVIFGVGLYNFTTARQDAQGRASGTTAAPAAGTLRAEDETLEYRKHSIQLYDFVARYHDSVLDGRVPGVSFKLRNLGARTLDEVEVTVYFKDSRGITIAEEKYFPVLVSDFGLESNKPLKPNYIWQLESGKFYTAKSVPSEWQEGSATAEVTEIRFAKTGTGE